MNLFAIIEALDLLIALLLITLGIVIQFVPIFEKRLKKHLGNSVLIKFMCNRYTQLVIGFFLILTGLKSF